MAGASYLQEARKRKSQELLLVLGSEPRYRLNKEWLSLETSPVLLSEWNNTLKSFLKTEQLAKLEKQGSLQGNAQLADGFRASFSIFQTVDCFKAHFSFEPYDVFKAELSLPPVFLETVHRRQGLVLLGGPVDPSKVTTLAQTLYRLNKEQAFHGAVLSKQAFPSIPEEKASFVYQNAATSDLDEEAFFAAADIVVLHETVTAKTLFQALDLCDEGKMVFMSIASNSLLGAFHKCLELLSLNSNSHVLWRFADHLKVALSQHPLVSLNQDTVLAFEMMLNTPQIRSGIAHGQLTTLETLLTSGEDTAGVLALNQSLLQLLIRRRIDIKQAFQASHDPNSLDQLLKKVGL